MRYTMVVVALLAIAWPMTSAGRGVVVSPVQLGMVGAAGSTVTDVITVSAARDERTLVRVRLGDFTKDENGKLKDVPPGDNPRSCKAWLELDQAELTIAGAGEPIQVRVTARIPAGASGSYWAVVGLEVPLPEGPGSHGATVAVVPRVAIPVIVTITGTEKRSVRIGEARARRDPAQGDIECTALIENDGNVAVLIRGAFSLERPGREPADDLELASAEVGPLTSLPGTRMKITTRLPWKGPVAGLVAQSYLRYGPEADDAAQSSGTVEEDAAKPGAPGRLVPEAPAPLPPSPRPTP